MAFAPRRSPRSVVHPVLGSDGSADALTSRMSLTTTMPSSLIASNGRVVVLEHIVRWTRLEHSWKVASHASRRSEEVNEMDSQGMTRGRSGFPRSAWPEPVLTSEGHVGEKEGDASTERWVSRANEVHRHC